VNGDVVVRRYWIAEGQGARYTIDSADLAIAHVHYKGLEQRPGPGDHSEVKIGRASYVISADGKKIWEVGRVEGKYKYREVQKEPAGSWRTKGEWK